MKYHAPPGVFDILPVDPKKLWRSSYLWNFVESVIRETAMQFGYRELRTPILEKTDLFVRGIGSGTDIVTKEMYTFQDRGGRSLSMRPEGTAPTIRAYVEQGLFHSQPIAKFYYIGPMFRYERSQAGRYRQHHQFGAEAIGNQSVEQDAELVDLLYTVYTRLGLKNVQIEINSIGSRECRRKYRLALCDFLSESFQSLSTESQVRFDQNPLRILDSKDPKDRELLNGAPSILDFLSEASALRFKQLQETLDALQIPYRVNPRIVRGLDYYNDFVFEVVAEELGAQNSIGGGGRYDHLIHELGGPKLPASGFGAGIERILQTLIQQCEAIPKPPTPCLFFIPLGEKAKKECLLLTRELRQSGVPTSQDFSGKKLHKAMQYANQLGARFVAVIGEQELESNLCKIKEMASGEESTLPIQSLPKVFQLIANEKELTRTLQTLDMKLDIPEAKFFLKKLKKSIEQTHALTQNLQAAIRSIGEIIE